MKRGAAALDISKITETLFISAWPRREHLEQVRNLGVRVILCMNWWKPDAAFGRAPLHLVWLPTFDTPLFPIPLRILRRGVEAALPVIREGWGVLAHCRRGVHRSVVMASCILIAMGLSVEEATGLIKQRRAAADPDIWYMRSRIEAFERAWKGQRG